MYSNMEIIMYVTFSEPKVKLDHSWVHHKTVEQHRESDVCEEYVHRNSDISEYNK